MGKLEESISKLNLEPLEQEKWLNTLKKYDPIAVSNRITKSLFYSQTPKLENIIAGLETTSIMPDRRNHNVPCSICNKMYNYYEIERHESRCSSIRFLKKKSKEYLNKEIPNDYIQKMWEMNEKEFDDVYCMLIEKFIPYETNKTLLHGYKMILKTRE